MTEWICVKDRLPELDKYVLVFSYGRYEVSSLYDIGPENHPILKWEISYCMDPTHWMPLPEAPHD